MIGTGDVAQAEETLKEARGKEVMMVAFIYFCTIHMKTSAISSSRSPSQREAFVRVCSCRDVRAHGERGGGRRPQRGEARAGDQRPRPSGKLSFITLDVSMHRPSTWVCVPFSRSSDAHSPTASPKKAS
jgi:hypothetical protein